MSISLGGFWTAIVTGAKTLWADISGQIEKDLGGKPGQSLSQVAVADIKQQASNLLAFADTEAGRLMAPAIALTEQAADTFLAAIPGGSLADPFANATIVSGFGILKGILDHAYAKAAAAASLPPPQVTMAPVPNPPTVGGTATNPTPPTPPAPGG